MERFGSFQRRKEKGEFAKIIANSGIDARALLEDFRFRVKHGLSLYRSLNESVSEQMPSAGFQDEGQVAKLIGRTLGSLYGEGYQPFVLFESLDNYLKYNKFNEGLGLKLPGFLGGKKPAPAAPAKPAEEPVELGQDAIVSTPKELTNLVMGMKGIIQHAMSSGNTAELEQMFKKINDDINIHNRDLEKQDPEAATTPGAPLQQAFKAQKQIQVLLNKIGFNVRRATQQIEPQVQQVREKAFEAVVKQVQPLLDQVRQLCDEIEGHASGHAQGVKMNQATEPYNDPNFTGADWTVYSGQSVNESVAHTNRVRKTVRRTMYDW